MKKAFRIILPVFLALCIFVCSAWYLLVYDREFTRDMLLTFARINDDNGNHKVATWFYNQAYFQAGDNDAIAIELSEQYKSIGNFTKAEFTLSNAIKDGGGAEVYIALSKTYVQQDKLLDAVTMLDSVANPDIKAQLEAKRPAPPTSTSAPGFYSQYISVTLESSGGTLYAANNGQYPSIKTSTYTGPIPLVDGENAIYAVTVADNGLVSPLSIFGYTVGGVVTKMEFSDNVMETAIRKALNATEEKELFTNDLWTIKEFTVPAGAKNYADLKHMCFLESLTIEKGVKGQLSNLSTLVNLQNLSVSSTTVTQEELAVIGGLPALKNLTLHSCNLASIAPLEMAVGLLKLDVSSNAIRALDAIRNMTNLQELYLQHNAVVDLTPVSSAQNLTKLNVASNSIVSLAPLANLTRLTQLDAGTNAITQLGEIGKMTALTNLVLKSNKLTNIKPLASCGSLKELDISSNSLTDISSLKELTGLEHLDFSYNQITKLPSFSKSCALSTVNGSHNKLTNLEELGGLKHLSMVNLDYNEKLSSVKALSNCPVLLEVNVYGTKVTKVSSLTAKSIIVNYDPT